MRPSRPWETSRPVAMQVRSSLTRVARAISPSSTSRVRPAAAGAAAGSNGRSAAARRSGAAAARRRALPAATRSRNSPIGRASRPRSRKTMKWLPSSITSSLCGTSRWCSRAAAAGTSGSRSPWTMSTGISSRRRMPRSGRWSVS